MRVTAVFMRLSYTTCRATFLVRHGDPRATLLYDTGIVPVRLSYTTRRATFLYDMPCRILIGHNPTTRKDKDTSTKESTQRLVFLADTLALCYDHVPCAHMI